MSDEWDDFDMGIYEEAWDYLNDNDPSMAIKVSKMVKQGKSPEEIKRRFIHIGGAHRFMKAQRYENAAKYLYSLKQNT